LAFLIALASVNLGISKVKNSDLNLVHFRTNVISLKEGIQYISTFFSYQEEQLKQGLRKLSEKI